MKIWMVATAGTIALALAGCNRGSDNNQAAGLPTPPSRPSTNGTGPAGLRVDPTQMANACLSPEDQRRPIADISPEQRRQIVACINAAAVQQINGQLPRQIDAATRLDRITAEGTLLTYFYTITRPPAELPPNLAQQLETLTRRSVCAQPQMRQTLELGGAYAYRWVDNSGTEIQSVRVDAC